MERMEEEVVETEYRAYQHFMSNLSSNLEGLQEQFAQEASLLLGKEKLKS